MVAFFSFDMWSLVRGLTLVYSSSVKQGQTITIHKTDLTQALFIGVWELLAMTLEDIENSLNYTNIYLKDKLFSKLSIKV